MNSHCVSQESITLHSYSPSSCRYHSSCEYISIFPFRIVSIEKERKTDRGSERKMGEREKEIGNERRRESEWAINPGACYEERNLCPPTLFLASDGSSLWTSNYRTFATLNFILRESEKETLDMRECERKSEVGGQRTKF